MGWGQAAAQRVCEEVDQLGLGVLGPAPPCKAADLLRVLVIIHTDCRRTAARALISL